MSKGGQQQQQPQDTSLNPLWISIAVVAAALLIWQLFREQIIYAIYSLKYYQAVFMTYFTDELTGIIDYLNNVHTGGVTFEELLEVTERVRRYIGIPYIVILLLFAIILYLTNTSLRFRKTYSMAHLKEQEVTNWPQIKPVAALNLVDEEIDKGQWAMGLSPMEFAQKNRLLRRDEDMANLSAKVVKTAAIDASDTKRIFTLQLGLHWEGIEILKDHQLALFAIFAARINRDRDASEKLLLQIAKSSEGGAMDFSGSRALAMKYYQSEKLLPVYSGHAYVYTVMASMLVLARADGVLPTAEFLWLKPIDRRLWYVLNSIGRQTPFVEVAGVYAHYLSEKALKRRSIVPMVDEAVIGLRLAVKEVKLSQAKLDELEA